jgi:hypothetical protein
LKTSFPVEKWGMPSRQKYMVARLHSLLFDGSQLPPPLSALLRGIKTKTKSTKISFFPSFNTRESNKKTQKQMNGR